MGMSPSCHCICPGDGGVGSSSYQIDTVTDCTSFCTTAARRYTINVGDIGCDYINCTCCDNYRGSFVLHHVGGCEWESAEKDFRLVGTSAGGDRMSCLVPEVDDADGESPRFTLERLSTTRWLLQIRYRLQCLGFPENVTEKRACEYELDGAVKDCMTGGTMTWKRNIYNYGATCSTYASEFDDPCISDPIIHRFKPPVTLTAGP